MEPKSPEYWSVKEVGDWLISLDLPQYIPKFEQMRIDGMLLFEMTDSDLHEDLQVSVRLHRFKILENIKKLKQIEPLALSSSSESERISWEILSLKAIQGQLLNNIFLIGPSGAKIGRNSTSNDIIISESFVSRKHCQIKYNPSSNQFLICDLGSTTGTFLMVKEAVFLQCGMMVQMGLSEFRVNNMKYSPYGSVIEIEMYVYEGPARQTSFLVTQAGVTIGRDPSNSYNIREDSQMSSQHANITFSQGKFCLQDLGSTNRTWIRLSAQNESSDAHPILVGDIIKLGSTVLIVQLPEESQLSGMSYKESRPVSEESVCKICFERETNAALYPCGHVLCQFCARKCRNCPVCRQEHQEVVRLYK